MKRNASTPNLRVSAPPREPQYGVRASPTTALRPLFPVPRFPFPISAFQFFSFSAFKKKPCPPLSHPFYSQAIGSVAVFVQTLNATDWTPEASMPPVSLQSNTPTIIAHLFEERPRAAALALFERMGDELRRMKVQIPLEGRAPSRPRSKSWKKMMIHTLHPYFLNQERGTKNKEPPATRARMPHACSLHSLEPLRDMCPNENLRVSAPPRETIFGDDAKQRQHPALRARGLATLPIAIAIEIAIDEVQHSNPTERSVDVAGRSPNSGPP